MSIFANIACFLGPTSQLFVYGFGDYELRYVDFILKQRAYDILNELNSFLYISLNQQNVQHRCQSVSYKCAVVSTHRLKPFAFDLIV